MPDTFEQQLAGIADENGVSVDAARELLRAIQHGGGGMAQFSHPELGGMGQWSRGGMLMIGDLFNHALKAKVDRLSTQLADLAASNSQTMAGTPPEGRGWWPNGLGIPSSTGSQNDMRYAFFPNDRRLAVGIGGRVELYDTADHLISGVSQQQSGAGSISFSSQHGLVDLKKLKKISGTVQSDDQRGATQQSVPTSQSSDTEDVLSKIDRLGELHRNGVVSEEEFRVKKAELLARL